MTHTAFIGLGTMGACMAEHLAANRPVRAWDQNAAALAAASDRLDIATDAVDAVNGAHEIVLMLPDTPDVANVLDEIRAALKVGQLVIDMSTISPDYSREIDESLNALGVGFVDAPVSGGPAGAQNATLSIMAGASDENFTRAMPLFELLGTTITHVGAVGAGQTAKLCNQLVCAINLQAISEALALGRANDLDLETLCKVMSGGSANSWMLENLGPRMISGDASAGFRIDLMLKDLRLVNELAFNQNVPLPGTQLATQLYLEAKAKGEGENGNQAIYKVYERLGAREFSGS